MPQASFRLFTPDKAAYCLRLIRMPRPWIKLNARNGVFLPTHLAIVHKEIGGRASLHQP